MDFKGLLARSIVKDLGGIPVRVCSIGDSEPDSFPDFSEHERQQILFNLKNTTPLQRLEWLEEALELLKPYLRRKE